MGRHYNGDMARGWESKSVEAQIEDSTSETNDPQGSISNEVREAMQRKSDLDLSRRRIAQQLDSSHNERYSELLRRTLADLDAQIAALN